jgi:hypothetical protein
MPVTPIIGARKIEQLKDNLSSLDLNLTAEQRERLATVSRIHMGFPHDFLNKELASILVRRPEKFDRCAMNLRSGRQEAVLSGSGPAIHGKDEGISNLRPKPVC